MNNNIFSLPSNVFIYRLVGFWLLLSLTFFFSSEWIAQVLQPFLELLFKGLEPEFYSYLALVETEQGFMFKVETIAQLDIYRQAIPIAPKGTSFIGFTSVFHSIAPLSLIFASCFVIRLSIIQLIYRFGFAFLFSFFLILLTTPFILLNNIESQFFFAAINFTHRDLPQPFVMQWTAFLELGGQWLIAIIFSIANLALSQKLNS